MKAPASSLRNIGPPESPWQVSVPPWAYPAQISSLAMISPPYDALQLASETNGTVALRR